ncbi:hypothetical protein M5Y95_14005, partial [Staphylococcus aureus]|uniref:hypothetical protein n=1 Tax=Staphylococcus aureus TaxID=1280 RepID=UPI0026E3D438
IIDKHERTQDGLYFVYIYARIDRTLLDEATSEETKRRTNLVNQIESLVLEGDESIKNGSEIRAVKNYMKAMALSYGLEYINRDKSFDEPFEFVVEILKSISMYQVTSKP